MEPGHPVRVEIRAARPLPVNFLTALTNLAQETADRLGVGTLYFGEHFRQDGPDFLFAFAGQVPASPGEDDADGPADEPNPCLAIYTDTADGLSRRCIRDAHKPGDHTSGDYLWQEAQAIYPAPPFDPAATARAFAVHYSRPQHSGVAR